MLPNDLDRLRDLLYRRQFLLSTDSRHTLPNSEQVLIGGRYHLSAHRDLELTHVESAGKSLTLLGFALDPDKPEATNEQILLRLIAITGQCHDMLDATDSLGGRWMLVVHDGSETMLVQDACAQRQVYFTRDAPDGSMMCCSETGLMAELLNLEMDPEAVEFIRSRETDDYEIYWMPGDTSLYPGIAALLPNHCLNLSDGTSRRFWPVAPITPVDSNTALSESLRLLRGQFDAARIRYRLSVPMTAGWDSRLMLALCKSEADNLHAFTLAYPHLPDGSRDVAVPARLLEKLGIHHHVIPYPRLIDQKFKDVFRLNNVSANSAYCGDIQTLHDSYPDDRVCVTGDAAEIIKCYYQRDRNRTGPVFAAELAEFSRLGKHPFALHAFEQWLEDARDRPMDLLDLFCWEQMAGRWQAKIRAEYDMVQESFSPLNNRRLLGLMLGVDAGLRKEPDYRFFARLIEELWPEVMSEPINPPERVSGPRRVINLMKKTGVLKLVPESAKLKVRVIFR